MLKQTASDVGTARIGGFLFWQLFSRMQLVEKEEVKITPKTQRSLLCLCAFVVNTMMFSV
jgi:hypothetical protein